MPYKSYESPRVVWLRSDLALAREKVNIAQRNLQEALEQESPYQPGDLVEIYTVRRGDAWRQGWYPAKVTGFVHTYGNMNVVCVTENKTGEWSKIERHIVLRNVRFPQGVVLAPTGDGGGE